MSELDMIMSLLGALTGHTTGHAIPCALAVLVAAVLLILACSSPGRSVWFLLSQALIPWGALLVFSLQTGQPMLQQRYLSQAQLFLIPAVIMGLCSIPFDAVRKVALGALFLATASATVSEALEVRNDDRITAGIRIAASDADGNCTILTTRIADAYRILYYSRQDRHKVQVLCIADAERPRDVAQYLWTAWAVENSVKDADSLARHGDVFYLLEADALPDEFVSNLRRRDELRLPCGSDADYSVVRLEFDFAQRAEPKP